MRKPKAELIARFLNPELYVFSYTEYIDGDFSEKPTTLLLVKSLTYIMPTEGYRKVLRGLFDKEYGPDFVRTINNKTTRWSDTRIVTMFHDPKRGNYPKYLLDDNGELYEVIDDCFPFRTIEAQCRVEVN